MKRCAVSLIIMGTLIETTMRYHLIQVRIVIVKKTGDNKCG